MTAGVSARVVATIKGTLFGAGDIAAPQADFDEQVGYTLIPGTALGKADLFFGDERTISASSSENLDLAGVLVDPLGATLTFAKIRAILIEAAAGNTNDVKVGGAGSNGFTGPFADATDILTIKPGGVALLVNPAGWPVVASTGDILKVANSGSGTGVTYRITIIGTSA